MDWLQLDGQLRANRHLIFGTAKGNRRSQADHSAWS